MAEWTWIVLGVVEYVGIRLLLVVLNAWFDRTPVFNKTADGLMWFYCPFCIELGTLIAPILISCFLLDWLIKRNINPHAFLRKLESRIIDRSNKRAARKLEDSLKDKSLVGSLTLTDAEAGRVSVVQPVKVQEVQ